MYTDKKNLNSLNSFKGRKSNKKLEEFATNQSRCILTIKSPTIAEQTYPNISVHIMKSEYISSVNVYANGAVNVFISTYTRCNPQPVSVIRIRPAINEGWNAINLYEGRGYSYERELVDDFDGCESMGDATPFVTDFKTGKPVLKSELKKYWKSLEMEADNETN